LHKAEQRERLGPVLCARLDELRANPDRSESEQSEYQQLYVFTDMAPGPGAPMLAQRVRANPGNQEANAALNREVQALSVEVQTSALARLTAPVVVASGEHDPRPAAALSSLLAALPHAERRVIADAGHLPWLESPAEVASVLARIVGLASG